MITVDDEKEQVDFRKLLAEYAGIGERYGQDAEETVGYLADVVANLLDVLTKKQILNINDLDDIFEQTCAFFQDGKRNLPEEEK